MQNGRAKGALRWLWIGAATVVTLALTVALLWFSRPSVTVTRVVEGPVVESFYATGTILPVTEYPIRASNAGVVTKLLVDKGQHVTKHETLAIVEDPQLRFQLEKARSDLRLAQQRADEKASPVLLEFEAKLVANAAMLENAKREEQRMADVIPRGGASRSDQERAADHVKEMWSLGESLRAQRSAAKLQLEADLRVAEAAEAAARRNVELQTLRSPIDGVVLDRPAPIGTRLNVNDHAMQIADVRPENLVMRAQVDEENVASLRDGQLVRMALYAFAGRTFDGHVTKIYDKADADRRTFEVDVKVDAGDARLAAGTTGELAFVMSAKDRAMVAPAQALQGGALYTVREGRLARVEGARVGIKSVERVELAAGFKLGETIVISPVPGLSDGARVRTTFMDPAAAAGLNKPNTDSTFKGFN